jgi:hypothetical protein
MGPGRPSRTVTGEGHYNAGPCDQFRTARFLLETRRRLIEDAARLRSTASHGLLRADEHSAARTQKLDESENR